MQRNSSLVRAGWCVLGTLILTTPASAGSGVFACSGCRTNIEVYYAPPVYSYAPSRVVVVPHYVVNQGQYREQPIFYSGRLPDNGYGSFPYYCWHW
jgi:hypothetical protein